jgi:hypothetical protein
VGLSCPESGRSPEIRSKRVMLFFPNLCPWQPCCWVPSPTSPYLHNLFCVTLFLSSASKFAYTSVQHRNQFKASQLNTATCSSSCLLGKAFGYDKNPTPTGPSEKETFSAHHSFMKGSVQGSEVIRAWPLHPHLSLGCWLCFR